MSKPRPLKIVETCNTGFAAQALKALLADEGIDAVVDETASSTIATAYQGQPQHVNVLVAEDLLEIAQAIVGKVRNEARGIDWDDVDLGDREDRLKLHPVPHGTPTWQHAVAITGLVILAMAFAGLILMTLIGL
jgi:hypothetical protein